MVERLSSKRLTRERPSAEAAGEAAKPAASARRPGDASGVHLWLVLWKAFRFVRAHAERSIEDLNMCQSDFAALEALLHKGPLTPTELGAKVLLTSGSITAAVDRLEERGMVERRGGGGDRRRRFVRLTRAGRDLIRKAFAEHAAAMEEAVSGLTGREREDLIALLRRLGKDAEMRLERGTERR